MSILCSNDKGWVISHYDYTKKIYTNVLSHSGLIDLTYNKNLFNIITPMMRDDEAHNFAKTLSTRSRKEFVFASDVQKKKLDSDLIDDELFHLQLAITQLLKQARDLNQFSIVPTEKDYLDNNKLARSLVDNFFSNIKEEHSVFQGGNTNNHPLIVEVIGEKYVFPTSCNFFSCPIDKIESKLQGNKYDFILLDPPWRNKFVRRKKACNIKKSYYMLPNHVIKEIPVSEFLNELGLVGVWCTNSSTHIEAVKIFFKKWGLLYVAEWYWVKVTQCGELVCNLTGDKKPFERIIFGAMKSRPFKNPEHRKVIVSVPSAIHSHKPPLSEVLDAYLPKEAKCLELFARYLLPGWTSVGNQVLLLQSLPLFE